MTVRTRELTIGKRLEAIDPGHSWTRKPTFRSSIFRLRHERPVRSTAGGRNHGIAAPRGRRTSLSSVQNNSFSKLGQVRDLRRPVSTRRGKIQD
jgi:hypothetical protein